MNESQWDAVIVGGGVAGISAALNLGRARRRVLVVDGGEPRNRFAAHMHGVLGHEGVDPQELLARGRDEAAAYGVEFAGGGIEKVAERERGLTLTATDSRRFDTRALIVATGLVDELPDVPGLAERWGRTVAHCPYCHGWELRDRRIGVIGSGMATHLAELLRQWSDRIVLFAAESGGVDDALARRLRSRGVEIVDDRVLEVLGEADEISAVRTESGLVEVDAIFTAGGTRPRDGFLTPLALDRAELPFGSFLSVDPMGRTSHARIWAAGNVTNPGLNVPMSMSAGSMAGAAANMALVGEDFDLASATAVLDTTAVPQAEEVLR